MNLSRDTNKSISLLLKSLKMNVRAIEKNQAEDGTTDAEIDRMRVLNGMVQKEIEEWQKASVAQSVAQISAGVAQPTAPIAPLTQPITTSTTTGDDDLTV